MAIRPEAKAVCTYLNALLAIDPAFMNEIVSHRPVCNVGLANHPTFQVGVIEGEYRAGLVGLLNGLLGKFDSGPHAGHGLICVRIIDDEVASFELVGIPGEPSA